MASWSHKLSILSGAVLATLSACATPRMHTQAELNSAGQACGLTYGELIQDEEAKKLLILFRQAPAPEQRRCVYDWARKNHLRLVVIDAIQFPEQAQ
jgi:hypothetical protein